MNKTLALLAALGLVATAPAFAMEHEDAAKTEATTAVKKEEKKVEKTVKETEVAPAAGEASKTEEATH